MEALRLVEPEQTIDEMNAELAGAAPEDILRWAARTYRGGIVLSTSFGAHSAVMLHMLSRAAPEVPVVFIDTGYLFPETYRFADELTRRLRLDVRVYGPQMSAARQEALHGKLWEQGEEAVERYLLVNKVEPMQRALRELDARAWIAGVRGSQTEHRASLRPLQTQDGRVKVHPILDWSVADMDRYLELHALPHHPLYAEGYRSIGDWHSTLPTTPDMDPRDGRLLGKKRECGLHLPLTEEQNQSLKSSGL
jgi:phosphoadenosine phosphosulfate reductase